MTDLGPAPSFRTYLHALRRRKWWVIVAVVMGVGISLAFTLTTTPKYQATTQLLVQATVAAGSNGSTVQPVTQTDVSTELQLVTSAPVQQAVRAELGSVPAVSAAQVGQTNVIGITATSTAPARAAQIANLYSNAFVRYRQGVASSSLTSAEEQMRLQLSSLASQIKGLGHNPNSEVASALLNQDAVLKEQLAQMEVSGAANTGDVALVTPAQVPTSPSSPKPLQDALLGLAIGLVIGLALACGRESLDDRLTSKESTEHAGRAPVLAMIPLVTTGRKQDVIPLKGAGRRREPVVSAMSEPSSPVAEAYRSLRTSLQFARQDRQLRVLLVTSPALGDGKTSTLANLGVVFAQAGERVLLVSGDLRRPRIGKFFRMSEEVGLTSVLLKECTLEEALQPVGSGVGQLTLLPSGPVPPNPAELLNGHGARAVFAKLREQFDLVLIDSPPVLPVTDAAILSQYADGTLLLAAAGQTRRHDMHRAVEKLSQVGASTVGMVLNKVTRQTGREYGYDYGYTRQYAAAVTGQVPVTAPEQPDDSGQHGGRVSL
jgi:polysaccharide biosynthesis transport protein